MQQDSLSSSSFVYQDNVAFKSPLKTPARDRANELVHSVSFYRKMQAVSDTRYILISFNAEIY